MVRPHFIPRTLRGVGGVRLFDIPGVVYPKEMLVTKTGLNQKSGRPYREAPRNWGIPTSEAARILGCSPSAARAWLHRRKVSFRIVGEEGQALRLYWHKARVEALAKKRLPVLRKKTDELVTSAEALRMLGVGRSTLYRYELRGLLSVTKVRKPSPRGLRTCSYYKRSELERMAKYLSSLREKEKEMQSFRKTHLPLRSDPQPPHQENITPSHNSPLNKKCK